jgi:23S rRNA-/tRNA-specific pseudouridylate synthase
MTHALSLAQVDKEYRALASGVAMADVFTVEAPIGQVPYPGMPGGLFAACSVEEGGKRAVSHCRVLERRPEEGCTLLSGQLCRQPAITRQIDAA